MNCCTTVLLCYYGNAIWCIDHVTKENLICNNMLESGRWCECLGVGVLDHYQKLQTQTDHLVQGSYTFLSASHIGFGK
jgi:hypothetical protein